MRSSLDPPCPTPFQGFQGQSETVISPVDTCAISLALPLNECNKYPGLIFTQV